MATTPDRSTILVVEDDASVREAITRALQLEGYTVISADDGAKALLASADQAPDALVLDWMLPAISGVDVARALRRDANRVPILMLTARGAVDDRVKGLDAGADDYLVKPFALDELLARLRALLRRTSETPDAANLSFSDLTLDVQTREAIRGDRAVELTRTEFNLLELFLRNPRQVLLRSLIYERVWGYDFGPGSHSLDVYIGYLRRKLEAAGEDRLIHTVRGVGYTLKER